MSGFRPQRLAEQINRILSELLLFGTKDPQLIDVTITDVEVTPDLQMARVFYTVNGDAQEKKDAKKALERATPFFRHTLGSELQVRVVPDVRFQYDESLDHGRRIDDLLRQINTEGTSNDPGDSADD